MKRGFECGRDCARDRDRDRGKRETERQRQREGTLIVSVRLLTFSDWSRRLVRNPRPRAVSFTYTSTESGGRGEFFFL